MQRRRHRSVLGVTSVDPLDQRLFPHREEEFLHIHRIHRAAVHLSDREGVFFAIDRYAEQTARRNDMILRCFLAKVFQRSYGTLAELHLIEHDQRPTFCDRLPADVREDRQQIRRGDVLGKGCRQGFVRLEIEVRNVVVFFLAELEYGIGLADLPRALQHQRLSILALLPAFQVIKHLSIHAYRLHLSLFPQSV